MSNSFLSKKEWDQLILSLEMRPTDLTQNGIPCFNIDLVEFHLKNWMDDNTEEWKRLRASMAGMREKSLPIFPLISKAKFTTFIKRWCELDLKNSEEE